LKYTNTYIFPYIINLMMMMMTTTY